MNQCHASLVVALSALANLGCTPVKDNPPAVSTHGQDERPKVMQMGQLQSMVKLALDDAARRTQRDVSTLKVASAETVTWPDASIGCPQPGMQYAQALVPGFRIRIQAAAEVLEYHAGRGGQAFYCPAGRVTEPAAADPRT
jgi:hypothetical protein